MDLVDSNWIQFPTWINQKHKHNSHNAMKKQKQDKQENPKHNLKSSYVRSLPATKLNERLQLAISTFEPQKKRGKISSELNHQVPQLLQELKDAQPFDTQAGLILTMEDMIQYSSKMSQQV